MSRPRSKTQNPARLCGNPSPSSTIDNFKAKIQDTDSRPSRLSLRQALHLRTPSTTSRPRSKTQNPACLAANPHLRPPSTMSRPRSKTWIPARLAANPHLCPPSTTSRPNPRHGFPPISPVSAASPSPSSTIDNVKAKIQDTDSRPSRLSLRQAPHLRTPLPMSRPRSKDTDSRLSRGKPSPSSTIDNVKAKIQDTDSRPSLQQVWSLPPSLRFFSFLLEILSFSSQLPDGLRTIYYCKEV